MLDKSKSAMLAAVEIYNKPSFEYREESYSILAINAWELLLKARILQRESNKVTTIIEFEKRKNADGSLSSKLYRKVNRSGNYVTIGLLKAYDKLNNSGDTIPSVIRPNLEAMIEIRDNSVHLMTIGFSLKKKVHEIGTANLKNYVNLIRQWFEVDLSEFNLFLMPIAFLSEVRPIEGVLINTEERQLLEFVRDLEKDIDDDVTNEFNLAINVKIKLSRVSTEAETEVVLGNSPDAVTVELKEADIRERYPWDYRLLKQKLHERYPNLKENNDYHAIRKQFDSNAKLCNTRYLDPGNTKSARKKFYSPNIIKEFDKHYQKD